jgi:hypothetical protein
VVDNFSVLNVWINVTNPSGGHANITMTRLGLTDTYYSESNYVDLGTHSYTIWASDNSGNWASASASFDIIDSHPPEISNLAENPDPQEIFGNVNWINISGNGNHTMQLIPLTSQYYYEDSYSVVETNTYTIWASDTSGNWNSTSSSFEVQDTAPPMADAGNDRNVPVGTTVNFDGSGSSDNSGTITNYTWVITKDGSVIATLHGVSPSFAFEVAGDYTVTLEVQDPSGNMGSDSSTVVVDQEVAPPGEDEVNILPWLVLLILLIIIIVFLLFWWRRRKKQALAEEIDTEKSIGMDDETFMKSQGETSQDPIQPT